MKAFRGTGWHCTSPLDPRAHLSACFPRLHRRSKLDPNTQSETLQILELNQIIMCRHAVVMRGPEQKRSRIIGKPAIGSPFTLINTIGINDG